MISGQDCLSSIFCARISFKICIHCFFRLSFIQVSLSRDDVPSSSSEMVFLRHLSLLFFIKRVLLQAVFLYQIVFSSRCFFISFVFHRVFTSRGLFFGKFFFRRFSFHQNVFWHFVIILIINTFLSLFFQDSLLSICFFNASVFFRKLLFSKISFARMFPCFLRFPCYFHVCTVFALLSLVCCLCALCFKLQLFAIVPTVAACIWNCIEVSGIFFLDSGVFSIFHVNLNDFI